jgi:clan AA aspartic protease (TIGR02281 family)
LKSGDNKVTWNLVVHDGYAALYPSYVLQIKSGPTVKQTTLLLSLVAGLVLGWYAHERWGADPVQHAVPEAPLVSPAPDAGLPATAREAVSAGQVDSVTQLLQRHAYPEAVARYESWQDLADAAGMQRARAAILLHAQELVRAQDFAAAARLLQRFLLAAYRDTEVRLLLAEVYYGQQDYLAAIEQLYEARGAAYRPEMLARITRRIRVVVNEQAGLYRKNADNRGLLTLFQNLTQLEPDYAAYFIELAMAQLALDDRDAAQRSLALVIYDPDVGEQAQLMLTKLQQTATVAQDTDSVALASEVAGIPLTRSGQHFLVDASPGDGGSLRLLIDTGASMTMVTSGTLQRQGTRYRDTGQSRIFNTANGPVRAPIYILETLSIGNWTVEQLEIGVLELSGQAGIDGLLGMNFLKHFRFFIDQNESMLRLSIN